MIVTLCVSLWKLFVTNKKGQEETYKKGEHIARSIWQTMPDAKKTIVIAERTGCQYCRASLPFYAKLTRAASGAGVEVVSVTTDDKTSHQSYLESHDVHVNRVVKLSDTPLKVSATPTLIVLDQSKTVMGAWVGQLSPDDEGRVMTMVTSGAL